MTNKVVYDIRDICAACGRPTRPGELLCEDCERKADHEFCGLIQPEKKGKQQNNGIEQLKIAVMLSDRKEQARLVQELRKLRPDADVYEFIGKDQLLRAARKYRFRIIFLCEAYGMESGIAIGRQLQKEKSAYCNLIYLADETDTVTLEALWEMHISGILPYSFSEEKLKTELENLRFPV